MVGMMWSIKKVFFFREWFFVVSFVMSTLLLCVVFVVVDSLSLLLVCLFVFHAHPMVYSYPVVVVMALRVR